MQTFFVDLNCDLGESFGTYKLGLDEEILPYITSANVACGFHAGDPMVMAKTVALCKQNGIAVGAHPSLPDLVGFGRRNMDISPQEAKAAVMYQVGAIKAFCTANGVPLAHVKPHGALYNMAGKDLVLARAIAEGIAEVDNNLILLGLSGSALVTASEEIGLKVAREVFADRGYEEDGSLVKRGTPGAMVEDENEAIARVVRMVKEGKVAAKTGKEIAMVADSVCVHGDGQKALLFVKKISEALKSEGVTLAPLAKIIG